MIDCYAYGTKLEKFTFSEKNIKAALAKKKKIWFDVTDPQKKEFLILEKVFNLHPTTTEDCFTKKTRVKVEIFDQYLFYALYGIRIEGSLLFIENDLVIGKNFLITSHPRESRKINELKKKEDKLASLMKKGVDFLFHYIVDLEIDQYFPILNKIDRKMEHLDRLCFKKPTKDILVKLDNLRDDILEIRRKAFAQRDKLIILTYEKTPFFSKDSKLYFRDVHDNAVKIAEQIDGLKEETAGALSTYLSLMSNRANEIMGVLTIIATIMLPLTFITGLYGMNFINMPELQWKYGYYMVLGFMVLVSIGMILYFKKRNLI